MTSNVQQIDIVPSHIRDAPPDIVTLISTEEELCLDAPASREAVLEMERKADARRQVLTEPLKQAGIAEAVIQQMSARELLACELIYVNPDTAPFLQKPSQHLRIADLYDGENVLEFRCVPDTPDNSRRNREIFYRTVNTELEN